VGSCPLVNLRFAAERREPIGENYL
jgi:hypothetical protein